MHVARQGTGQGAVLVACEVVGEVALEVAGEVAPLVPREVLWLVAWEAMRIAMGEV